MMTCLGVDGCPLTTLALVGPLKLAASVAGGLLKYSYVISLIIFLFPRSGILVSWLSDSLSPARIPLLYPCFGHFVLFSFPEGFLNFILILLLNFFC